MPNPGFQQPAVNQGFYPGPQQPQGVVIIAPPQQHQQQQQQHQPNFNSAVTAGLVGGVVAGAMMLRRGNDDNSLGLLWSRVKSLICRRLLKTWIWHLVVKKKIKIFNTDNLSILYILLLFLKFLICIHPGKGYWPVASLTVCVLQKKWRVRLATR